jgi:hypothetical protein
MEEYRKKFSDCEVMPPVGKLGPPRHIFYQLYADQSFPDFQDDTAKLSSSQQAG